MATVIDITQHLAQRREIEERVKRLGLTVQLCFEHGWMGTEPCPFCAESPSPKSVIEPEWVR